MTMRKIKQTRWYARYKEEYITFREGKDFCLSRSLIAKANCYHGQYFEVAVDEAKRTIRLRPMEVAPGPDQSIMVVRLHSPNHLQFSSRELYERLKIIKVMRHRPAKVLEGGTIEFTYPVRQKYGGPASTVEGAAHARSFKGTKPDTRSPFMRKL
jgi:hypothetical protein